MGTEGDEGKADGAGSEGSEGGEPSVVAETPGPRTRASLATDLLTLGVAPGDTLLVHASLRSLGWVVGRQVAVVQALLDAVGPEGTLVVPTQTGSNSDPSGWQRPPVPAEWWPVIRAQTPAYDPRLSPGSGMGVVAESVRTWPGAARSGHPQTSFAAVGARAEEVVAVHDLDSRCGERSPLATLERLGARVLFLGTGWGTCTAFHLAEYRVVGLPRATEACSVAGPDGQRVWTSYEDVDIDEGDFGALGDAYEADCPGEVVRGPVGSATARLFELGGGVAYATGWLSTHRERPGAVGG